MYTSISKITNKYLRLSNYNIDSKTLELQLLTHPDYPSFKSISDTFDYFEIENIVAKVPKEIINKLPTSFITLLSFNGKREIFILNKKGKQFTVINENLKIKRLSLEKLHEIWDGTIIAIEERDKDIQKNVINFTYIGYIVLLLLSIFSFSHLYSLITIIYCFISLIGLMISYFIVQESFGVQNEIIKKVCNITSQANGCNSVINDKNSKLFKIVSLSDATITYFLTILTTIIFLDFNHSILFISSLFSLPIIFYSFYKQLMVLKQWCALCIGISIILFLQFIILLLSFSEFKLVFIYIVKTIIILICIILILNKLKNLMLDNIKLKAIEVDSIKFKRNKHLFERMLTKEKLIYNNSSLLNNKISFGSDKPKLIIDAVTNPFCGFCVESFMIYDKILSKNSEVQLNLIFSVSTNNPDNIATKIILTILDLYTNKSKEVALKALKFWFNIRDFEIWSKEYEMKTKSENDFSILISHQNWIESNKINYTPATFINEYYYPIVYKISDLEFFIDDL